MMPADEVVSIVDMLEGQGLQVWLDGGWGVDALVGRQTRKHEDLDIAIALAEADAVIASLVRWPFHARSWRRRSSSAWKISL